jgi:hypothetical protein
MNRLALVATVVLLSARAALAQQVDPNVAAGTTAAAYTSVSSTIVAPITVVGAGIYAIFTTMKGGSGGGSDVAAEAFLRSHSLQLSQDLTNGAGPALADIAAAAEIRATDTKAFGQLLRAHRAELLGLANPDQLNHARAAAFMKRIGDLVKGDKALAANFDAYVKRHGQG